MNRTKFLILRGPSGSGKSTVAKMLFNSTVRKTALIEQDYYRFIFNPPGGGGKPNIDTIHQMIKTNTLIALENGYDVILEGILSVKSYSEVLDQIFEVHQDENYMYYFDISLKETLERHKTRTYKFQDFGENEMRKWYAVAHRSNHRLEQIIPESYSLNETFEFICKTSNLI